MGLLLEVPASSWVRRPVLFLDLDDTVSLPPPYGGYDAAFALSNEGQRANAASTSSCAELWEQLFDVRAVGFLRSLNAEFCPQYVLSMSWWWLKDDPTLSEALRRGGLDLVADNLHPDSTTPKGARPDSRWTEINAWLRLAERGGLIRDYAE